MPKHNVSDSELREKMRHYKFRSTNQGVELTDEHLDYLLGLVHKEREAAALAENDSIRVMLAQTIELGRNYCYNHEKYVSQCYACQTAKWTKIIAKMYLNSIKERIAELTNKEEK